MQLHTTLNTGELVSNDKFVLQKTGQELSALSEQLQAASEDFAKNALLLAEMNSNIKLKMDELNEKMKNIEQINQVIINIASQSHMLGLNAAIEAARAGEQGRSFSVVADEVRKLASVSKESAKDINGYIQDVLNSAKQVLILVEDSKKASAQQAVGSEELSAMVGHISELAQTFHSSGDTQSHHLFIEWDSEYNVNLGKVDDQHKKLIDLINELYLSMQQRRSNNSVVKIISELSDYTKTHFRYEEDWMVRTGYKDFSSHKAQHDAFVNKVMEFQKLVEQRKASVTFEILKYLKDWLLNHILVTDKKLSRFVASKT